MKEIVAINSSKKGEMDLTIKSLFAILLVLIVFFVVFTLLQSDVMTKSQELKFSQYKNTEDFFMAILSTPCLTIGNYSWKWQYPIQGVLDYEKIDYYNNKNEELKCVENFDFLYSIIINDLENGKQWIIGLRTEPSEKPEFAERMIANSLVVSIKYNTTIPPEIHTGRAILKVYTGNIPSFIGTIKRVCHSKTNEDFNLRTDYTIRYNNVSNTLYIGKNYFYPYFSCPVSKFLIKRGDHIISIRYSKGGVRVIT